MLTQSVLMSFLDYDQDTGVFRWKVNPGKRRIVGSVAGCVRPDGYRVISLKRCDYRAHHLAWLYVNGALPKNEIDHIDGRPDNNAIANLRAATRLQNLLNIAIKKNSLTGFKNVQRRKDGKFVARIRVNGKRIWLGSFNTPEDAYAAACRAGIEGHREYFCDGTRPR